MKIYIKFSTNKDEHGSLMTNVEAGKAMIKYNANVL